MARRAARPSSARGRSSQEVSDGGRRRADRRAAGSPARAPGRAARARARSPRRWAATVSASPRAIGPVGCPPATSTVRCWSGREHAQRQVAVEAGPLEQVDRRPGDRDEVVRGEDHGGVVGDLHLVGERERLEAEVAREAGSELPVAGDGGVGALELVGPALGPDRLDGWTHALGPGAESSACTLVAPEKWTTAVSGARRGASAAQTSAMAPSGVAISRRAARRRAATSSPRPYELGLPRRAATTVPTRPAPMTTVWLGMHWAARLRPPPQHRGQTPMLRGARLAHAHLRVPVRRLLGHVRGARVGVQRRRLSAAPTAAAGPSRSSCRRSRPRAPWARRSAAVAVAVAAAEAAAAATDPESSGPLARMRSVSDAPARAAELERLADEWRGCTKCALSASRTQVVVGHGPSGRRPDVRRRGAGLPRGQAGRAVRRPGREGARARCSATIGLTRAGRLHRQRAQVPPAREPRPAARRDRGLRGAPVRPGRADPAEGDLHARQLRDQAPLRPAARHHPRPRPAAAAPDRRRRPRPLPDLPPRGGALHAGDDGHARGRLRAAARAARRRPSRRRRAPVPVAVGAPPEPVAEPEPASTPSWASSSLAADRADRRRGRRAARAAATSSTWWASWGRGRPPSCAPRAPRSA